MRGGGQRDGAALGAPGREAIPLRTVGASGVVGARRRGGRGQALAVVRREAGCRGGQGSLSDNCHYRTLMIPQRRESVCPRGRRAPAAGRWIRTVLPVAASAAHRRSPVGSRSRPRSVVASSLLRPRRPDTGSGRRPGRAGTPRRRRPRGRPRPTAARPEDERGQPRGGLPPVARPSRRGASRRGAFVPSPGFPPGARRPRFADMCHDVSPQTLTRPRDRGNFIQTVAASRRSRVCVSVSGA